MSAGIGEVSGANKGETLESALISYWTKYPKEVAFAVSTVAMLILSPFQFILGSAAGYVWERSKPTPQPNQPILTPAHAAFTLVGAVAALLCWTPVGLLGGRVFHHIPFISSFTVGTVFCLAANRGSGSASSWIELVGPRRR